MTARFDFIQTPLQSLLCVQRKKNQDARGFLSRFYCAESFAQAGLNPAIAQINHTFTQQQGTVRGMHFQYEPHAECKLVSCLQGEIFDVAVDLRADSPTFLQWHGEILSAQNQRSLYIPKGFAHGFQTLTDDCELLYLHSAMYAPQAEGALNLKDPMLAIDWPLPISEISARDQAHAFIKPEFQGIIL